MIYIAIIAILAGIVQGVTGFGAGIVMMMVLPSILGNVAQSAGVSAAICIVLNLQAAYLYRKHIDFKKALLPIIPYLVMSSLAMLLATQVDQDLMKKILGGFLLLLSIYYLFINKNNDRKKLTLFVSMLCIVISGLCDGLFGIGGPLMVLYFLSTTHNTHQYLGTIQTFFCINCIYNTCFRLYNGILQSQHFLCIALGMVCILVGGFIANKIVDKLDGMMIKKLTYIMIGFAGIMNLL